MLIYRRFRFRVYPSPEQEARLRRWEDALRFLWNLALEQRLMGMARARDERVYPTAFDQQRELTELRAELPWLADVPRDICAHALATLDRAWQQCFLRLARAPGWKCKGRSAVGLCENHPKKWGIDSSVILFPKLGRLRAVVHRPLSGRAKTCTLKRDGDQWFACIACEIEIPDPAPRHEPVVAIDRGVVNIVADSDGRIVESPRFYAKAMSRLARAQRNFARKQKGSKNREKAKLRVMRIHRKVRRQRGHFIHVLSHDYAKSHGTIVVEKLRIDNMTRSGTGTIEAPGKNVRAKASLSRGILDSGWGMLAQFLGYKLARTGGRLLEVVAAYSSQECSACGCIDARNRKSQALVECIGCGNVEHADVNASKVLKSRANRSAQPVEGSPLGAQRSRKRLRSYRRSTSLGPSAPG